LQQKKEDTVAKEDATVNNSTANDSTVGDSKTNVDSTAKEDQPMQQAEDVNDETSKMMQEDK